MDEKRRKGLCYHYDDKWGPRHVCKKHKVYLLQMEEPDDEDEMHNNMGYMTVAAQKEIPIDLSAEMEVSIHAISSSVSFNATKLLKKIGNSSRFKKH